MDSGSSLRCVWNDEGGVRPDDGECGRGQRLTTWISDLRVAASPNANHSGDGGGNRVDALGRTFFRMTFTI
jgi:hypothetical protein